MRKIIAMTILPLVFALAIPILSLALTVDGVLYDKTMRCLIVTGGFGKYPGTDANLANDGGHTANLLGASGTPIASYGYWYNSVIGIDRSKQVGAGSYVNGGFDGYVQKSTWQYNNANTGTGYQGSINSIYRGISRNINQDLVTNPFRPEAPNLVWSFNLQKNTVRGNISGLDSVDQASAAMAITGTGLPNSTSYGSSGTYSLSGTASLSDTVSYGNYYISFFIPNASKYNITYRVMHVRGDKNGSLNNNANYYYYNGSASFSSPYFYIESGGTLDVSVTAAKKNGTVIVDLNKGTGVTETYENKTFGIYNESGVFLKSATTNTSGYAYFYSMPYGNYSVQPNTVPTDHYYSPASQNITLASDSYTSVFTLFRNTGSLHINYATEDGLSESNVRFKITNPKGIIGYYYTNLNGEIDLPNIITGDYRVEQMEAPADYEKAGSVAVTVSPSATTTIDIYNPILYDFSVDLSVPSNAKQSDVFIVTATFHNKGGKAAIDVPVKVTYQGIIIYDTSVSIPANGDYIKEISLSTNTTGYKTIIASINESAIKLENNTLDNTDIAYITIETMTNLQIEFINPNAEYREGTDVISTFRVKNTGVSNILPGNNLKASLSVVYPGGSIAIPLKSQIVIPANGSNIVFFKWSVPDGMAGREFILNASVNPDNTTAENNFTDNNVTVKKTIIASDLSNTPDTRFEKSEPFDFTKISPPAATGLTSASWTQWAYIGGKFIKRVYGLSMNPGGLNITPDENSPSRKYLNNSWYMASGYGVTATWNLSTSTPVGKIEPDAASFTEIQVANASFPEFMYGNESGKYKSLSKSGVNIFEFPSNIYAPDNRRLHYTPLWFPDGDYVVQGFASDLWTPAGMLYGYTNSNAIVIAKSALDDWYIGRQG